MKIEKANVFGDFGFKYFLYLGWIFLFLFFFFKGCGGDSSPKETAKIIIPAITKTFEVDTTIEHHPIFVDRWYKDLSKERRLENATLQMEKRLLKYQAENDSMQYVFLRSDSIKRAELYSQAIQTKEFSKEFEDDTVKIKLQGFIAGGMIKEFTPTYTIKQREVDVSERMVRFRMLVGVGMGNSMNFDKPLFNGSVGFQNAKGNIFRATFDTDQRIMVGYDFSILRSANN